MLQKFLCLTVFFQTILLTASYAQQTVSAVYKDKEVVDFFRRTSGWIAGDGAFTVPLSDGRILWVMGDSHINDYDSATHTIPCLFQVNNAAILQHIGDWNWRNAQTLISHRKGNKSFFRDTSNNKVYYWPISGIQLGDTVYVYYSGATHAKGGLGFASTGKDVLAKIKFPEMEVVGFHWLQDFDKIGFGRGLIKSKDGKYVFVYGERFNSTAQRFEIYVARFPSKKPNNSWRFWNGKQWDKKVKEARPIGHSTGMTPMVAKIKHKFLLVSTEPSVGCDMGKRIYTATGNSPTGPFTNSKTIYTIDDTLQGHYPFFYVPVAHPALINNKGELLITYNVNGYGSCIEGCVNNRMNPDHYRPRGIRAPLGLIDSDLK